MKKNTFEKIRKIVSQIPEGRVATYGDVAKLSGLQDARIVGWAIYGNEDPHVPCHRVVNKEGYLAKKFSLGGWREQKKRLEPEGVIFVEEDRVDLEQCRIHQ